MPDAWEIANGLDPTDNGRLNPKNGAQGDLDGDGLSNAAERKAGTRANLADTDGDGVNDYDELNVLKTSPLRADVAAFQSVTVIPGSLYTATTGAWLQASGKAKQDGVRGSLDYPLTLAAAGVYQLDLTFTPAADVGVCRDYEIVFSVDGKTVERQTVTVAEATSGHAKILSPWLTVGSHSLRVFVDNSYHFRRVTVDQLEVLAARGPDANSNGTPDWVDIQLASRNSFKAPATSLTSPVCLEGKSRWSQLTRLNSQAVQPAPDDGWFTNLPLSASATTPVLGSLENGAIRSTRLIKWLPLNLLTTPALTLRLGDSLRLTAFTGLDATAAETVSLTLEGQARTLAANKPLVYAFTTAGNIPIQVSHRVNGVTTTVITVITVVAAPVIESPVCVVGHYREVNLPVLPINTTLQLDNRIEVQSTTTQPDGSTLRTLRLNTLEDRSALLRLGPNGSILGSTPFRMMRLRTTALTGVFIAGQVDSATYDIQMPVIVDGLYAGTKIDFSIFIGGVIFDDGKIVKSLTIPGSVNANGETILHFYKTGDFGSNCHHIDLFQGNKKIANY